jgi:co-chaperonin GroES (HSP10)
VISDSKNEGILATVIANHGKPFLDDGRPVTSGYEPGAVVLIGKYTGTKVTINREEHIVLAESSVIAEFIEESDDPAEPSPSGG